MSQQSPAEVLAFTPKQFPASSAPLPPASVTFTWTDAAGNHVGVSVNVTDGGAAAVTSTSVVLTEGTWTPSAVAFDANGKQVGDIQTDSVSIVVPPESTTTVNVPSSLTHV